MAPLQACGCLEGLLNYLFADPPVNNKDDEEDDEFFALLDFLAEVPLFKNQLPSSDLPDVANAMKPMTVKPGQAVTSQGVVVEAFHLIQSGKALVIMEQAGTKAACAELQRGDFFGARALVAHRPAIASVIAAGPEPLKLLTISRDTFESLGLHKKMSFPPRPAIDGALKEAASEAELSALTPRSRASDKSLDSDEVEFIEKAIKANSNLKVLGLSTGVNRDVHAIAELARRRELVAGQQVCVANTLASEFIIVAEGCLAAEKGPGCADAPGGSKGGSAEKAVLSRARLQHKLQVRAKIFGRLGARAPTQQPRLPQSRSMFVPEHVGIIPGDAPRRRNTMSSAEVRFKVGDVVLMMREEPKKLLSLNRLFKSAGNVLRQPASPKKARSPKASRNHESQSRSPKASASPRRSPSPSESPSRSPSAPAEGSDEDAAEHAVGHASSEHVGRKSEMTEGVVVDVLEGGDIMVFSQGGFRKASCFELRKRPHAGTESSTDLELHDRMAKPGDTLGELSLLYNTQMCETWTAEQDSVIYVIARKHFKAFFKSIETHKDMDLHDWVALLEEVPLLSVLLHQQRQELARNATGLVSFAAGEAVFAEGQEVGTSPQWYIIERGECVVSQLSAPAEGGPSVKQEICRLQRGNHFGERELLRGDSAYEVSLNAGPCGMMCLVIDGCILKDLSLGDEAYQGALDKTASAREYFTRERPSKAMATQLRAREIEMCMLDVIKVLGRGGFGTVALVRDRVQQDTYALKKMSIGTLVRQEMQRRIVAEREIMALVDSPFIVTFYRSFRDKQHVYFLLEAARGGDLLTILHFQRQVFKQPKGFTQAFYIGCVALALAHLHSHRIVYRDLKPENVILNDKGYAKLCDFGFARFCFRKTHTFLGTPEYMAPEMINPPHRHDHMVDWWGLGVMAFELFARQSPFFAEGGDAVDPSWQLFDIRKAQTRGLPNGMLPKSCPEVARDMMRRLVRIPPSLRLCAGGANEILEHPFFAHAGLDIQGLQNLTVPPPYVPEVPDDSQAVALDMRPDAVNNEEDLFREFKDDGRSSTKWLEIF